MKTIFKISLVAVFAALVWSCDTREKEMLVSKVDSLEVELITSQRNVETLQEIGDLIDAIDDSREMLRTNAVEGTSYDDYKARLEDINGYIKDTRSKIHELENSLKKNSAQFTATINRLKKSLEESTEKVALLQTEIEQANAQNNMLTASLHEKDVVINDQLETIKLREDDILSLETKVEEIGVASKMNQADLYFAQAEALLTAAERTKFAPKKKKETQREALELYRMSLSLGKEDAQNRIVELEKDLG
ncbi:MAG: hypothetical protein KF845_13930 [Cyclobacteriaceae bacterium]|nr:hypothetical protein [Cyclobacteriaceae bacterium]